MNSGSVHRLSSTLHYLSKYDYSPYGQEITEDDLVIKENGSGSENVSNKIRIYQVTAINPAVFSKYNLTYAGQAYFQLKMTLCNLRQGGLISVKLG